MSAKSIRHASLASPPFTISTRRSITASAEDAAQKLGYNLPLCASDDDLNKGDRAVELLLSKRIDGMLTNGAGDFQSSLRQTIADANIPFALLMRTYPQLTKDAVISDDCQGAYEAVRHLDRSGRKRVSLVSGPLRVNAKERFRGFREALEKSGLPFDPPYVSFKLLERPEKDGPPTNHGATRMSQCTRQRLTTRRTMPA